MGKTYKIIVCGKKALGKTSILEHLIYNNSIGNAASQNALQHGAQLGPRVSVTSLSSTTSTSQQDRYFSTIEDIYVACWEKDKGVKEKLRFYDTKGMENAKDTETINQSRHLFSSCDGAVLIFSSSDHDSVQCIERLKQEIEKSKDKKEICHFILIDNNIPSNNGSSDTAPSGSRESNLELQSRLRSTVYEIKGSDKREALCKPFIDLATNITQLPTKGSMGLVKPFKGPKVFSSNK